MDENSVSSQMFLILLYFITPLVQKAKFNFCIQVISKQYSDAFCFISFFGGGGACAEAKIWKTLASILKYYPILHDGKKIRLA